MPPGFSVFSCPVLSLRSSIRQAIVCRQIAEEGFESTTSCLRCVRLNKVCVLLPESSDKCGSCVSGGNRAKYEMPEPTYSDTEWRKLIKAREEELLAKLLRLRKQEKLLRRRAGDFIARGYKEIAELEELERREAEELKRLDTTDLPSVGYLSTQRARQYDASRAQSCDMQLQGQSDRESPCGVVYRRRSSVLKKLA